MSTKKARSFNSYAHHFAKVGLSLSRRDNLVFYKLLGFLLRNDKPFPYSNEKLAEQTLYKISSVKEALNNLEQLGLIIRTGITYRRRFSKGLTLVNICNHSQYCIYLDLDINYTHGQRLACASQKLADTSQSPTKIELNKTNKNLKKVCARATSTSTSTSTPVNMEYHDYCKTIENDRFLGLPSGDGKIMTQEEFERE